MKLDAKKLKQLISEAMKERQSETMLLEEPVSEMSTAGSVADRVNVPDGYSIGDTGRVARGFVFISADRKVGTDCKGEEVTQELNNRKPERK